jgi:hypothetical protein
LSKNIFIDLKKKKNIFIELSEEKKKMMMSSSLKVTISIQYKITQNADKKNVKQTSFSFQIPYLLLKENFRLKEKRNT